MTKKFLSLFCLILLLIIGGETWYILHPTKHVVSTKPISRPLLAYTFPNLKKTSFPVSKIQLDSQLASDASSMSQVFYYSTPEKPTSNTMKRVSGLINVPTTPGKYPVIVMLRGYVPQETYAPGIGTQPVARQLAQHGFITLAPDFLGFGTSSPGATDSFENRFQTYTTALSLLSSLSTLNDALTASYSGTITADLSQVGIWGHSNGGHIALATLALSGVTYPTVLWAPVSTAFPYSILYYTDESDDQGKVLRRVLAHFETLYNTDLFSPPNYYQWIKAPMEINQGTADEEVPYWWSDTLVATLKKNDVPVTYNTFPGADHNMLPSSTWNSAVSATIAFYINAFKK